MKWKHANIIVFCVFLMGLGAANLLMPNTAHRMERENRMTTELLPLTKDTLFTGDFFQTYEQYYSDHFVGREHFIGVSKGIQSMKGLQLEGPVEIVDYAGGNVTQAVPPSSDPSDPGQEAHLQTNTAVGGTENGPDRTSEKAPAPANTGSVAATEWGRILIYKHAAMELNTFNEEAAQKYAAAISKYATVFPDVRVHSMMIPTQIEFVDNPSYKEMSYSQRDSIQATQDMMTDDVQCVDVYSELEAHTDEYIYYRTDHHWTQRGAFYGYAAFAKHLGLSEPSLSKYAVSSHDGFLGSLYRVTMSDDLKEHPDTIEVYDSGQSHTYSSVEGSVPGNTGSVFVREKLEGDEMYGVFLGGDYPLVKVETQLATGRNILVIKDSYANALVPYLMGIADKVVVIDPRLYGGTVQEVVAEQEITDIVFVNYALITRWGGYDELYEKLLGD